MLLCAVQVFAQTEYPFQDTSLTEDQRLDNAVSLMTVEEKLATITGQGVPRLGIANPAGRLTQTWVSDILDLPNMLDYYIRNGRTYMYAKAKPIIPFGHGLSYTTFKYSKLRVRKDGDNYVVRFNLKNTGSRDGEEVVQLYAKFSKDDASKRLRGFERVAVKAGENVPVQIIIPSDDLKLWDSENHHWAFRGRKIKFQVGASSEDIRLRRIESPDCVKCNLLINSWLLKMLPVKTLEAFYVISL